MFYHYASKKKTNANQHILVFFHKVKSIGKFYLNMLEITKHALYVELYYQ